MLRVILVACRPTRTRVRVSPRLAHPRLALQYEVLVAHHPVERVEVTEQEEHDARDAVSGLLVRDPLADGRRQEDGARPVHDRHERCGDAGDGERHEVGRHAADERTEQGHARARLARHVHVAQHPDGEVAADAGDDVEDEVEEHAGLASQRRRVHSRQPHVEQVEHVGDLEEVQVEDEDERREQQLPEAADGGALRANLRDRLRRRSDRFRRAAGGVLARHADLQPPLDRLREPRERDESDRQRHLPRVARPYAGQRRVVLVRPVFVQAHQHDSGRLYEAGRDDEAG